jgi:hypothetical protein
VEHVQPGVRENAGIAPVLVLPLEMEMLYLMGVTSYVFLMGWG